jgi:integrase
VLVVGRRTGSGALFAGGEVAAAARAAQSAPLLPQSADARLLNAAETARDRVALLLLLDLGIRRSELTGVRPSDVDLGRRQITVTGDGFDRVTVSPPELEARIAR